MDDNKRYFLIIISSYILFYLLVYIINKNSLLYLLSGRIFGQQLYLIPSIPVICLLVYYDIKFDSSHINYIIISSLLLLYCAIEFLFGLIFVNISTVIMTFIYSSNLFISGIILFIYHYIKNN